MPPPSSSRGWLVALSSPIAIAGIALALSIANPGYVDTTRELLLQNIYRKETTMPRRGGGTQNVDVVVRDGVVYKYNKYSGSVTATAKDGLMVDKNGDIFVVVRGKDDPRRVKKAYLVGNMDEVPPLPANPTEKDKKAQREAMEKTFAGAFYLTLVPIRPRSRGERRSLRTFPPGVSLRSPRAFNPDTPRRLSTPTDAYELHPDIRRFVRNDPQRLNRLPSLKKIYDAPDPVVRPGYQ